MNDYITLDGFQYRTTHPDWSPFEDRPMIIRRLLSGGSNVTFGPATFTNWKGVVVADVVPEALFGSIDNLTTTFKKRQSLSFTDHYGTAFTVVIDRTVDPRSLSPMWDGADNTWKVNLTLVKL